jgi:hypothetical protein
MVVEDDVDEEGGRCLGGSGELLCGDEGSEVGQISV